jgi:hypothetical protein
MEASRRDRLAPLTGVVFVVLLVTSIVVGSSGSPEDFPGKVDEIVEYYEDHHGSVLISGTIGTIAAFFFLLFAGTLRARLAAAEGGDLRLASTAFAGAIAVATVGLAIDAVNLAAGLRAEEDDKIAPAEATALFDLQGALVGAALPVALAVMIAATGALALRAVLLPRWFGFVSLVLAIGLLIIVIAFFILPLALLWVVVVSVLLIRAPAAAEPAATTPTTAA